MQKKIPEPRILVIVGSTRPGRVGRAIADWFSTKANEQSSAQFEVVDLVDWDLPFLNESEHPSARTYQHNHTKQWSAKIAEADGYVIVTPEYNRGYPAPLKNALDYLYHEWAGKPVAFVGYGMDGGRLAVEQLHQVIDQLQMQLVPEQLAIALGREMFDEHKQFTDPSISLGAYIGAVGEVAEALVARIEERAGAA